MRVGYELLGDLDGGKNASKENRGIVEFTGRYPFPHDIWLVNRFRTDLRWRESGFSARLRERLRIESEIFVAEDMRVVPYAQAEFFYNTQYDAWSTQRYQGGVEFQLTRHWAVEPYYARQEDQRSNPPHMNRIGLTLTSYW
jgi:hypothetical protein